MAPAIGITTQLIRQAKWYKYVGEFGLDTVEINRQNSKLHFNFYFLEKIKKYMKGFDLSIHSGTAGVFQPYESFSKANLSILIAEIDLCCFLDARQFIFHLDDGFISTDNKKRLNEVLSYAVDSGIEMLYESNSILAAKYAYDFLESFPNIGYVLDLGHLNNGYVTGKLGCAIDDFIKQVRGRIFYIHASNNSGLHDEHNGLDDGTLDWRNVLDMLDISIVKKIIIEVRQSHMVNESVTELSRYLSRNATNSSPQPIGLGFGQCHDALAYQGSKEKELIAQ